MSLSPPRINAFLTLLAVVFAAVGCFLQWELIESQSRADRRAAKFRQAMENYERENIYYDPQATITWLRNRQNPAGYFVPNPDLIFEPSQRNANTLRATRYAIATLRELDALDQINRRAVVEFVLANYVPNVAETQSGPYADIYRNGRYAGFRTLEGKPVGVRPTMDALIILDALNALDDPRIRLEDIRRFILVHQNPDGGFWDEHYPESGQSSCLKCTSFALRALGVMHRHTHAPFPPVFKEQVAGFVARCRDPESGGYGSAPGKAAEDLYNVFRAFITLWWLGGGSDAAGQAFVRAHMDVGGALDYANREHYLPAVGAFARYRNHGDPRHPSLKATHLMVWLATALGRVDSLDVQAIARFTASKESRPGEYGGDIYSTYSATGIFKKLGVRTSPLPKPVRPPPYRPPFPAYLPPLFFVLALVTLTLSYLSKRQELETINQLLAHQAAVDGLTGALNRLRFEELLSAEMRRAQRYGSPLSVILFDADRFKHINDRHGHLAGDRVLRALAEQVTKALRAPDQLARWGGEEFIVLAPGTDLQGALRLAEKLRQLVERTTFEEVGHITCSFGVAQYRPGEPSERFLERADQALYQAKHAGRNRVCAERRYGDVARVSA